MMDPLRNMMMSEQQKQLPSTITIEEGMDCRDANSRFFNLVNQETHLNVIISKVARIISCKLNDHEIVVDPDLYHQSHETWAIGDRPFQRINSLSWNCHVRGAELLLTSANGTSSILYELSKFNELNSIVKLKSIHMQHQVTYFNLNDAKNKASIDGHTLVVQCNGNMNRIQFQDTKLLCQCNKKSSVLPQSLIGDIPFELVQRDVGISQNNGDKNITTSNLGNEDDIIICDAIYSLESTCPLDVLQLQLRYNQRALLFETRSSSSSLQTNTPSSSNQNTCVTSTTQHTSNVLPNIKREKGEPVSESTSVLPQTSTILRVRVRVTNFGICIMPVMMTNYTCMYRFIW